MESYGFTRLTGFVGSTVNARSYATSPSVP